jgi:DNA invertase Pin-like site-specific DNA recombinase
VFLLGLIYKMGQLYCINYFDGPMADVERELIATRTAEGRSRAQARGQHMGRPSALTLQQQDEARCRRAEGATLRELATSYNVGIATISGLS